MSTGKDQTNLDLIETEVLMAAVSKRFAFGAFIAVKPGYGAPDASNVTYRFWGDMFAVRGCVDTLYDIVRDGTHPAEEGE